MDKPQLFLLHFAGGNYYSFRFIIPFLKDFSVIPLELPGRGNRMDESLMRDLDSAVQDITDQILDKLDGSNFVIYGHSMGAILALKTTEILEQLGKSPSFLFVSGHEGPPIKDKKRYLFNDEDLIKELRKYGGALPEILKNTDFLDFYLPILRADMEVAEKNSYCEPFVNTPIYAMMGTMEEDVEKISNWKNFTKSTFNYRIFEGGHFFIFDYPQEIVNLITETYNNHIS